MQNNSLFVAGIGIGLLLAAFLIKLFDGAWLVVSLGVLLGIVGGTGIVSKKRTAPPKQ